MFDVKQLPPYDRLLYRRMRVPSDELKERYEATSNWIAKICLFRATRPLVIFDQNSLNGNIQKHVDSLIMISEQLAELYQAAFYLSSRNKLLSEWVGISEEIWGRAGRFTLN